MSVDVQKLKLAIERGDKLPQEPGMPEQAAPPRPSEEEISRLVDAIVEVVNGCDPRKEETQLRDWLTRRLTNLATGKTYAAPAAIQARRRTTEMTAPNPHATQTHLQPLQRAFHAFRDFTFEHGGLLKNHKRFHELASDLYKEICNLNARAVAVPEPAAQQESRIQLFTWFTRTAASKNQVVGENNEYYITAAQFHEHLMNAAPERGDSK